MMLYWRSYLALAYLTLPVALSQRWLRRGYGQFENGPLAIFAWLDCSFVHFEVSIYLTTDEAQSLKIQKVNTFDANSTEWIRKCPSDEANFTKAMVPVIAYEFTTIYGI